jgi:hypothetical protein
LHFVRLLHGDPVNPSIADVHDHEWEAARIAVLFARSAVTEHGLPAPTVYRLAQSSVPGSAEDAARYLAELAKPLKITSTIDGTCVVLKITALHDDPWAASRHRGHALLTDDHPLEYITKRYGGKADELIVTCYGAGELLRVSGWAVAKWERDYYHENRPDGAGFVDSEYAAAHGIHLGPLDGPGFVDFGWAVDDRPPSHSRGLKGSP